MRPEAAQSRSSVGLLRSVKRLDIGDQLDDLAILIREIAERAESFTGATGVMIALKRRNELVVRTSIGIAPEVGACIPWPSGVTGLSVTTKKPQTCASADAEAQLEAVFRALIGIALAGLLFAGRARAAEVYSYVDDEGVLHFSNAPTDARYRKVHRTSGGSGVYRPSPQARARPIASPGARPTVEQWREHIRQAAEKYKLPEALLLAVMAVESNFDSAAVSRKGARGLGQVMFPTARAVAPTLIHEPEDLYDVRRNLAVTARHLRDLLIAVDGDLRAALTMYHRGPHNPHLPKHGDDRYVGLICTYYSSLKVRRRYGDMVAMTARATGSPED